MDETPDNWGGYQAAAIFDNENFDDPRRQMSWSDLLAHAPTFKVIRYQNADLDEKALFELVRSKMFGGVEYLDLRRNFRSPDDALMARLIRSELLRNLRFLSLANCYQVGDETLAAIGSGLMPALERLAIDSTKVTDAGLEALASEEKTPKLRAVEGEFLESITAEGVEALKQARPGLSVGLQPYVRGRGRRF